MHKQFNGVGIKLLGLFLKVLLENMPRIRWKYFENLQVFFFLLLLFWQNSKSNTPENILEE